MAYPREFLEEHGLEELSLPNDGSYEPARPGDRLVLPEVRGWEPPLLRYRATRVMIPRSMDELIVETRKGLRSKLERVRYEIHILKNREREIHRYRLLTPKEQRQRKIVVEKLVNECLKDPESFGDYADGGNMRSIGLSVFLFDRYTEISESLPMGRDFISGFYRIADELLFFDKGTDLHNPTRAENRILDILEAGTVPIVSVGHFIAELIELDVKEKVKKLATFMVTKVLDDYKLSLNRPSELAAAIFYVAIRFHGGAWNSNLEFVTGIPVHEVERLSEPLYSRLDIDEIEQERILYDEKILEDSDEL